jgi:hypothetical protein
MNADDASMRAIAFRLARTWTLVGLVTITAVAVRPAAAHVPQLRGRLIDLVGQSDLVVVGTVEEVSAPDRRSYRATVRVDDTLIGEPAPPTLTARARLRFAIGQRFVFFLRRDGTAFECVQPSGAIFPSRPTDDAGYREAVTAIRRALAVAPADRNAALRAAVIPALSARAAYLRYQAVLELGALAHDGMTASERALLERQVADPTTDPTIRSALVTLLRATADGAGVPAEPR